MRNLAGIAISWRAADLVVVERRGRRWEIVSEVHLDRAPGTDPVEEFRRLLREKPLPRGTALGLGLSGSDLAISDAWPVPEGLRPADALRIAGVHLESRSAGETLEQHSWDVLSFRTTLLGAALRTERLAGIRRAALEAGCRLRLVAPIPALLATSLPAGGSFVLVRRGERIEAELGASGISWRVRPVEDEADRSEPAILDLGPERVAAYLAATAEGDRVPDVLRGAPDAPRRFGERYAGPLRLLGASAALALLGLGLFFHAQGAKAEGDLALAEEKERELWRRAFPSETPKRGELLRTLRERLRDQAPSAEAAIPSAFRFFAEIGRRLPNADEIGMALETLDLTPEGGRLTALVPAVQGDPLRNAARVERALDESPRLGARGDFETRGPDVQVRLRIDFQEGRP